MEEERRERIMSVFSKSKSMMCKGPSIPSIGEESTYTGTLIKVHRVRINKLYLGVSSFYIYLYSF